MWDTQPYKRIRFTSGSSSTPTDGVWDRLVMIEVPSDHELKAEITAELKEECARGMFNIVQYTTDSNPVSEVLLPLGIVALTEIISCTSFFLPGVFPVPIQYTMPSALNLQLDHNSPTACI